MLRVAAANALPYPFDQAISLSNTQGRAVVENLVTTLRVAESSMEDAFNLFNFQIPDPEAL